MAIIRLFFAGLIPLLLSAACYSQNVKGLVTDTLGKPIPYANVVLKNSGNVIMAYTVTNDKGEYVIAITDNVTKSGAVLEASCVGYIRQSKAINNFEGFCNFKMLAAGKQLNEVAVKSNRPFLKVKGDTTSYKVSDFSSPQDRVIGDVIKKLPGIDVAANGKISYNGKAISGLYIGGDNLLDDKYNIATNNIPSGAVNEVQVMENHQPVKALKDKVNSDDVALNLTFKPDAKIKLVGQETLGAGLPGLYYEDLNAMLFKDKYKAINYVKANDAGYDVQNDLVSHNVSDYLRRIDNDKPNTILSLGTAGDPDLPRNRYLFNQVGLLNLNNLVNLKKDVKLKANIAYLHDSQRQGYQKLTELYSLKDTIRYTETQANRRRSDLLHTQFSLNINKPQYYLNNILIADYNHNAGYSDLNTNGVTVNQAFKDNVFDFSNEFNFINTTKSGRMYEVYSYINRFSEPQSLTIAPGLTPQVFNNGSTYAQLWQSANVPAWFTNNYVSYKIPAAGITQSYKVGASVQKQQLQSALNVVQYNGSANSSSDSAINNLSWLRSRFYIEPGYDMQGKKLKLSVGLSLILQRLTYQDDYYNLNKSTTQVYFNPKLSGKYQTGAENYVNFGYNFHNDIGNVQDVFRGDILKNYRTLYANNANLTERQTQTAILGFNYRKAITLLFLGVNTSYTHSVANNITSNIVTSTLQQRIVLPFENSLNAWQFNTVISKYVFALRTTVSAGLGWQSSKSNQIQNNVILPYNTIFETVNAGAETKLNNQITFSYKAYYTQTDSRLSGSAMVSTIRQVQQKGEVNYSPVNDVSVKLSGDYYFTHQTQASNLKYAFADATIKYKFNKLKTDVELSAVNLFNVRTYSALYLSANTFTANTYTIPGRMVLMKVLFSI